MYKFVPTTKEKWVIDRLKRDGWKLFRDDYSNEEICFYRPFEKWGQFDWCGTPLFIINRRKGTYIDFRNSHWGQQQIHHRYYLAWPTKKNWEEIDLACLYFGKIHELSAQQTLKEFVNAPVVVDAPDHIITCVYCGQAYPEHTPTHGSDVEVLTNHIKECPKHPMRKLEEENQKLREDNARLSSVLNLM